MVTIDPPPLLPQSSETMMLPGCRGLRATRADTTDRLRYPRLGGWDEDSTHAPEEIGAWGLGWGDGFLLMFRRTTLCGGSRFPGWCVPGNGLIESVGRSRCRREKEKAPGNL